MRDQIKKVREALQTADVTLYTRKNRLRARELQLVHAKRRGKEGTESAASLEREIASLKSFIARTQSELQSLKVELSDLVGKFVLPQSPQQLASQLDDSLPCLLLPLRMETRFMGAAGSRELWVRVYPDDIAVHTHEKDLTRDEADSGVDYWSERTLAASAEDAAERERLEKGAWRALTASYGGTRASWIAAEIKRRATDKEGSEDFSFLLIRVQVSAILNDPQAGRAEKRSAITSLLDSPHPLIQSIRGKILDLLSADEQIADPTRQAIMQTIADGILTYLGIALDELKPDSWNRAPRSEVMPDRFVLIGFAGGIKMEWSFPNAVPNPLILGPNPQNLESELAQQDGDLVVGEDYAWIGDFDKAIEVGMAMRVPLQEPLASAGFDRLIVLGMRVSSEAADHKALLEELIDNHHYAPEGMSFLPQGTPTNHTGDLRSGFSPDDAEGDASFETETKKPAIQATTEDLQKTDAQRLAEAWDISLDKLAALANAGRNEVAQAKMMNRALWPATLGYFLEELLEMEAAAAGRIRVFFAENVVARGSLPAIRVGKQPYGILVTSAFSKWQINETVDGKDSSFFRQAHDLLKKVEDQWQQLVGQIAHVDGPGDPFEKLLNMLGLQATSVDYARRIGTYKTMLWNTAHLRIGRNFTSSDPVMRYFQEITSRGIALLNELGLDFPKLPRLFGLLFSNSTSGINGPLVDDVELAKDEKLSETAELPSKYSVTIGDGEAEAVEDKNYIGWLVNSNTDTLKQQLFKKNDQQLPIPTALLYRMLHRSLLLSHYDATMNLYEEFQLVDKTIRREQDFTNVEAGRTVTRWEFMEASVNRVMPQLSQTNLAIGDFLATPEGLNLPAAFTLREVRENIAGLEKLKTAELERLFTEHVDLCSYRLDAWQTALFAKRLERLNLLRENPIEAGAAKRGLHLGAYGWLENVRPAPAPVQVSPDEIPADLREDGVSVIEQPDNGGYIHGPSINHAVAAAVLRNAYLTHADQDNADHFSIKLTSDRVRIAFSFLEGVRNGQELGALLGYQFERALHDRYVVDGQALDQFILAFRTKYPLVADKITPDEANEAIDRKEASQVVDGYALLEAVFLQDPPLQYPYGVEGLPANDGIKQAIIAEVARLEDTLDAIADLSLAEGVFQVTQGNYERAGAMLKALSEGNAPPEPEIVRSPRSGAVVNHKLAVHFATDVVASPWSVPSTPKSLAAPGLNKWLGDLIGAPDSLLFSVSYELDNNITIVSLAELELQPIDLIYLIGDQASAIGGSQQINDLTELEARIDYVFRLKRQADDPDWDSSGRAIIHFMSREGFPASEPPVRTFFESLPLLRNLRKLVTSCRPLGADDYSLASEENTDPSVGENPKRWDLPDMKQALDQAVASLENILENELKVVLASIPPTALSKDPTEAGDLSGINYDGLRSILVKLSYFGLPGAFPKNALLPKLPPNAMEAARLALLRAQQSLIEQGFLTYEQGVTRYTQAKVLSTFSQLSQDEIDRLTVEGKAGIYQQAGALILGDAFRFIPTFAFKNRPEIEAAHAFSSETSPDQSLMRFTHGRLKSAAANSVIQDWRDLAVEEWLQGVAAVREKVGLVDQVQTYQETFAGEDFAFKTMQLPFDEKAHWIALEFPEVSPERLDDPDTFVPTGDFLSIVRQLPVAYSASAAQSGLLIDEWNEVIPNRIETTGIAIHYNQPNTEPPQCLLLAVSPVINGQWEWDDLVDTLTDTFDRAKRRAVEPDFLRATPYAQLLPAVLSTFTSHPFGTISTNLAAQPASMVVEQ